MVILRRSPLRQYIMVGSNFVLFAMIAYFSRNTNIRLENYGQFLVIGLGMTVVSAILYFGMGLLLNADARKIAIHVISKLRRKHNDT